MRLPAEGKPWECKRYAENWLRAIGVVKGGKTASILLQKALWHLEGCQCSKALERAEYSEGAECQFEMKTRVRKHAIRVGQYCLEYQARVDHANR